MDGTALLPMEEAFTAIWRQWKWRHSRKPPHGIERPIGNFQLFQNELLQVGIACGLSDDPMTSKTAQAMQLMTILGQRARSGPAAFRNAPESLCRRKPIHHGCRRSNIRYRPAGLPDPVADAIPFGLRKAIPYRRTTHECHRSGYIRKM
jgi:hypothetical protein